MLPQTNLQLYRLMIAHGSPEADLSLARHAYDLARQLFTSHYRPSHKPFLTHLIGAAGALASWGEPIETVVAGMLHSAYLYGDYGDGKRGVTEMRRRITCQRVGEKAEGLIFDYTRATWSTPLEQMAAAVTAGAIDRTMVVMKLADLCDDCCDAAPKFAPAKSLAFGLSDNRESQRQAIELVASLIGPPAAAHFSRVLTENDVLDPPAVLRSSDRSYHVVGRVDDMCGSPMVHRLYRLAGRMRRKRVG